MYRAAADRSGVIVSDNLAQLHDLRLGESIEVAAPTLSRLADGRFDAEAYPLASVYSTDIQNIRTDEDGAVWFCSDRGLFRYSPETAAGTASQPPPLIARITTGEDTVLFAGWQRAIAKAVKNAREMALLPYASSAR